MNEAHELAEKIEGAGHGGGHGAHAGGIGKFVGLTMAVIGVLLAICSAYVGSERTELVQTMVEQSNTYSEFQASSTKYRAMMAQIQQTYAVTPSRKLATEALERLDQIQVPRESQELATLQKATLKELTVLMTPRKSEVESFLATIARYDEERKAARAWAESYEDEVHAHFEGSEDFEKAQLLAEIGIVIASIALLRSSKPFWYVSIVAARADALALGRSLEVVQALLLLDGTKTLQEVRKAFRHHALLLEGLTRLVIDEADLASPGAQREHEGVASSIFRDGQSVRREGRDARRRCSQQRVGAHALALDGDLEERVDAVAVLVRDRGVVVTPADVPDDGVTPVVLRQKRPIVRR